MNDIFELPDDYFLPNSHFVEKHLRKKEKRECHRSFELDCPDEYVSKHCAGCPYYIDDSNEAKDLFIDFVEKNKGFTSEQKGRILGLWEVIKGMDRILSKKEN